MGQGRIAVVGAGPIGIETGLYARTLGYDVTIFEQGSLANNVKSWGFVQLFTPWSMNATALGRKTLIEASWKAPSESACPTGAELVSTYLQPLAGSQILSGCLRDRTSVIAIGRDDFSKMDAIASDERAKSPFRILIRDAIGRELVEHADIVIDCSGTYGVHRWAGRGGLPAPGERLIGNRIRYTIPDLLGADKPRYAQRHTLLIGCGFSAATALFHLARLVDMHPNTRVTWAIRRIGQALESIEQDPLPLRRELVMRSLAMAEAPPDWLQFLGTAYMEEVRANDRLSVKMKHLQTTMSLEVDEIVALVGYRPDDSIHDELQVYPSDARPDSRGACSASPGEYLRNTEPNFFILGAKSFGTNSSFLLQSGHTQVRDLFRLIAGDPGLDLYAA